MKRVNPLVAGNKFAVEDHIGQRLAVDREIKRLPHFGIGAERIFPALAEPDIDVQALVSGLECGCEFQPGIGPHLADIGRQQPLEQIDTAGFQIGKANGGVGDRQVDDASDMDVAFVPVILKSFDHDAILLHALDEPVRPGADRLKPEFVAGFPRRPGRHHDAGAIGELADERSERLLQHDPYGQRVDDFDAVDRGDLGLAERARQGRVPIEGKLCGFSVEPLPILEQHTRTQPDRDGLSVGRGFVSERKLRRRVQVLVDIEQFVANRREYDFSDIGPRQSRIQDVRILRQTDPQRRLSAGCRAGQGNKKHRSGQSGNRFEHRASIPRSRQTA